MRSPGFFAPRRAAARRAPPGPLGMKKERRSPRRPFPVKICENSRPPSRRPCPLSLDIPGFSHVLPSCPALSRLSQLSCLFTLRWRRTAVSACQTPFAGGNPHPLLGRSAQRAAKCREGQARERPPSRPCHPCVPVSGQGWGRAP